MTIAPRSWRRTLAPAVLAALLAVACGSDAVDDQAGSDESATTSTSEQTTTTSTTTTTTETPTTSASDDAPDTSEPAEVDGMAIYEARCVRCHAADGSGGRGPSLQGIALEEPDPQAQIDQVTAGGRGMPAFDTRLSAAEIVAVVDYLRDAFPAVDTGGY